MPQPVSVPSIRSKPYAASACQSFDSIFPKPFNKNVVHLAAFAVHADGDVLRLQRMGKNFRGKLTVLIRVKDFMTTMRLEQSITATR
jgi:hypothetical protein